jgi:hypothetical protein
VVVLERPDRAPLAVPVWFEHRAGRVLINSARGRAWPALLEKNGRATLLLVDPLNQYRYLAFEARLLTATESGAYAHITRLAKRYTGRPFRVPNDPAHARVKFELELMTAHAYPHH